MLTTIKLAPRAVRIRMETTMLALLVAHTAVAISCAFFVPTRAAMAALYGTFANFILLAYYCAPLSSIAQVLKDKSAVSIYFPTVLVNLINGAFWSTYGLAISDVYLLLPNAFGVALSAVQAMLCFAYDNAAVEDSPEEPQP